MSGDRIKELVHHVRQRGLILGTMLVLGITILGFPIADSSAFPMNTLPQGQPESMPEPVVKIAVAETYVNDVVAEELTDERRFSDIEVDLQEPNEALVTVSARIAGGIPVRPTVTLAFEVIDNQVQIEVTKIRMSNVTIPRRFVQPLVGEVTDQMEDEVNRLVVATERATGLVLTGVHATETELIIEFSENENSEAEE